MEESGDVVKHDLGVHLSNSFSVLAVSERQKGSRDNNHNISKSVQKDKVLQQIQEGEQEIIQLRRNLAEYLVKEARILEEKHLLETRIASMYNALDQKQQEVVEATSKALSFRQEILEENIRLVYALREAREEKSVFISFLVPLLTKFCPHPPAIDAHSIVSNLRVLFKHTRDKIVSMSATTTASHERGEL